MRGLGEEFAGGFDRLGRIIRLSTQTNQPRGQEPRCQIANAGRIYKAGVPARSLKGASSRTRTADRTPGEASFKQSIRAATTGRLRERSDETEGQIADGRNT